MLAESIAPLEDAARTQAEFGFVWSIIKTTALADEFSG